MNSAPVLNKDSELRRLRAIGLSERDFERLSAADVSSEVLSANCIIPGGVASALADTPIKAIDVEKRIVSLSFSNEDVFARWFGNVKLDHSEGAARLDRLNNGAPFLLHHDQWNPLCHVGTVIRGSARIESDRFGRADVLVSGDENEYAKIAWADMQREIRTKISILVYLHKLVLLEQSEDGPSLYLATDWEPVEISLLPVAAIDTIGIGLSFAPQVPTTPAAPVAPAGKGVSMPPTTEELTAGAAPGESGPAPTPPSNDAKRISQLGQKYGQQELALKAIEAGLTFEAFKDQLLGALNSRPLASTTPGGQELGLTDRQINDFRLLKLAAHMLAPSFETRKTAGFELDCCREAAKLMGFEGQDTRYTLPGEVFRVTRQAALQAMLKSIQDLDLRRETAERLAVSSVSGSTGGFLVGQQTGSLVELLRELTVLGELGVNYVGDLRGDFSVPKMTGGLTYGWLGDEEDGTASDPAFGELEMHPRTAYGLGKITRKMLLQSSYDVEMLLRADIFAGIGNTIQQGVFYGPGGMKKLLGLAKWSGVGSVIIGDNGGDPTRDHLIQMETQIFTGLKGQFSGNIKYVTNGKVRGKLMRTAESAIMAAAGWVWKNGDTPGVGSLNGYPVYVTGDVPSNLTRGTGTSLSAIYAGVWQHMLIGLWGPLQIDLDDGLYFKQGGKAIRGLQDVDMGIRHLGAFSALQDATTV